MHNDPHNFGVIYIFITGIMFDVDGVVSKFLWHILSLFLFKICDQTMHLGKKWKETDPT